MIYPSKGVGMTFGGFYLFVFFFKRDQVPGARDLSFVAVKIVLKLMLVFTRAQAIGSGHGS